MSIEDDLTVLIDYEKYPERVQPIRVRRQMAIANFTQLSNGHVPNSANFTYRESKQAQLKRLQSKRHDSYECDESDNDGELKIYFNL